MNTESTEYMKAKGIPFDCEDCTKHLKQSRGESTPIKSTSQSQAIYSNTVTNYDTDIKKIVNKLDEVINNQITTNNTLTTLSNRILDLEKTLKEKEGIITNLEFKINVLEQNERACFIEINGVKKEINENIEELVNDIASTIDIDLNLFDIENAYRKPSNQNLQTPQIIVEFSSKRKRNEFIKKRGKLEYKGSRIYINENLTAYNRKLLWETRTKAKELGYRYIWTSNGRIYCKKDEMAKKTQIRSNEELHFL